VQAPGPSKSFVVECYWPGVGEAQLADAVERAQGAASELRIAGANVSLFGSILMPGDETVFLLFQGTEDDIRATALRAGIAFERIVESHWRDSVSMSSTRSARSRREKDRS
jgi:hypothetical protein